MFPHSVVEIRQVELDINNTGILDMGSRHWLADSHAEPNRDSSDPDLDQLVSDLIRTMEMDAVLRRICLSFLSRFDITSWEADRSSIKFWCNGIDATFRSHVAINPFDRLDPPMCLLTIQLGDTGRTLYGSVVADLRGAGPLLLSHAVRAIIVQALETVTE
jgi:hypothetical protein